MRPALPRGAGGVPNFQLVFLKTIRLLAFLSFGGPLMLPATAPWTAGANAAADWHAFEPGTRPAPAEVRVVSAGPGGLTLEVGVAGVVLEPVGAEGALYHRVSLPEASATRDVGRPELPELRALFAIPATSGVVVTCEELSGADLSGVIPYPVQSPGRDGEDRFVLDRASYAEVGGACYPLEASAAGAPGVWRDLRVCTLVIRPVRFEPAAHRLHIATRLRVEVRFEGTDERDALAGGRRPVLPRWARQYERAVLNYSALGIVPARSREGTGAEFLVITTDALYDSVYALADWHERAGTATDIVPLSQVGSTTDEIKDYIRARYVGENTSAVLLVGDVDDLPIRLVPTGSDLHTPSDHWYACIAGSDLLADVDLARLSATTPAGVAHQVRKILTFEQRPPADGWTTRSLLCSNEGTHYIACKDQIAGFPYAYPPPAFEKCYAGAGGSKAQVVHAIETGVGLVNYRGHGLQQSWFWSIGWDVNDVHALRNGDHLPLVFNVCCDNGWLDYGPETLAEAWMNAEHGAAGNLAATRDSWTDPNHVFDRELYKAIYQYGWQGTLEVVNWARNEMMNGDPLGQDNGQMYVWLGDPLMPIWTDVPAPLLVDHPPVVALGETGFVVAASDGAGPLAGALVCLRGSRGDVYQVGETGPDGSLTLSLAAAAEAESLDVTVSARNHLPYLATVPLVAASGPSLVCSRRDLDDDAYGDSDGDGDGVPGAGETIELSVTLRNVGATSAANVSATLSSTSPHIHLVDSLEFFGEIAPFDSASCTDDFEFRVDAAAADGETAEFRLVASSGDSTWQFPFSYALEAPVLAVAGWRVVDAAGGDGDGWADPGEEVELFVSLGNDGSGEARELRATLTSAGPWARVEADSSGAALLEAGAFTELAPAFRVSVPPDAPVLSEAPLRLELHGRWELAWTGGIVLPIAPWHDEVENGAGGWTHAVVTPGFHDLWHRDLYENHTPGGRWSWRFGALEGGYAPLSDGALVSQPIALGMGGRLTFWHKMEAETSAVYPGEALDGGVVEVSLDGGPWQRIAPVGGYTWTIRGSDPPGPFAAGTPCFSGAHGWRQESFDLTDLSGELRIRFRFGSNGEVEGAGWAVDDVVVSGGLQPTAVPEPWGPAAPAIASLRLGPNRPNPFRESTILDMGLPRRGHAVLGVYDVRGRCVQVLFRGEKAAGTHSVVWDGRDAAGRPLATGVYFVRLEMEGESATRPLILIR